MDNYINLVSGFSSSILTTAILYPLDLIRLVQITHGIHSVRKTVKHIYQCTPSCGLLNFYRCLPTTMLAYSMTYTIFFPLNEYMKRENPLGIQQPYMKFAVATIPPSILSMTICNPVWTIKANQISSYLTFREALKYIYEMNGYRGFYKGLLMGYLNNMNGMISFTFYDIFKHIIRQYKLETKTIFDYVVCSMVSKAMATLICYPFFFFRIHQQVDFGISGREMYTQYLRNPKLVLTGLLMTLAQQLPKNTLLLILYEVHKEKFTSLLELEDDRNKTLV